MKPVRLTVDLSPELFETVQSMAEQSYSTKAEIMRRSLALMATALHARASKDGRLAIVNDKDEVVTEIVGY
jgi:predicted transcriptional regulator